jgi:hypothetical protein
MAKALLHRYTFTPSTNTIVIEGNIHRRRLLLITNVTDNKLIYNFADPNLTATSITFDSTTEETTVVLSYDTSAMSSSDTLQILVEEDSVRFRPSSAYTDPVSKFRISQAQTLIDTDFEYGLQYTKWETLELVNNIPGFYSSTGDTPLNLTSITGNSGSNILTVTAVNHGLIVGTPFDIRGLNQSNLDGSYIVDSVSGSDSFTFTARNNSNTTGTLSGAYTYLVPGKFYTGSDISYTNVTTDAASPSVITVVTPQPHGFSAGTEFYIIDTLGTQTLEFDAANVDPNETVLSIKTFDPNEFNSTYGTGIRKTDIWDYQSELNTKFARCGTGGDIATNVINIAGHGFANTNVVAVIPAPGSTVPTGLTAYGRYYVVSASTNSFSLSLTSGGAAVSITAESGSGIIGLYRGYTGLSMTNTTNDRVNFNENTSTTPRTTPLLPVSTSAVGTNLAGANLRVQNYARLYDDSTAAAGNSLDGFYYFSENTTTSRAISLTSTGGKVNLTSTPTMLENVFIPVTLNTFRNTFYITGHGFSDNELWAYSNGGGTSISDLTSGTSYYIDYVDENQFGLKTSTVGSRIDITGYAAVGAAHSFSKDVDNPTKNTINIPGHGFTDNLEVTYVVGSGTSIGGLTDGITYYTRDVTTDRFRLAETQGSTAIDLTSAGVGVQTFISNAVGAFDGVYRVSSSGLGRTTFTLINDAITVPNIIQTFDPQSKLYIADNFIEIPVHRFNSGTPVTYSNGGGGDIGGLTDTSTYYVIRIAKDGIRLATSYSNAIAGIAITFSSTGSGTQHTLTSSNLNGENVGLGTIRITSESNIIEGFGTKFNQVFKSGDSINVGISSTTIYEGTVYGVLSDTEVQVITAPTDTVSDTYFLKPTALYVKSNAFSVHRPFDGGVEINAGFNADAQIVRQTRRYFRYQSGKGLASQFAVNFNPPIDISTISGVGTVATVVTRYPHGLTTSQAITIRECEVTNGPNPYNGDYNVKSVIDTNSFDYYMDSTPSQLIVGGFPQLVVDNWGGAKLRAGMYDFQNGMFYEYDGEILYAVRRDSTSQLGGTCTVTYGSNLVTGSGSRYVQQLVVGDRVVIRGQSYKVIDIPNNSTFYVQPAYRGTTTSNVIVSKTIDTRVAQSNFSIDPCDGSGPTGYVLDVSRIQMAYMDYSWYGAGKIRFGFKDQHGEVAYVHEFKHNNKKNEAFMRSGNLPARYEILNQGVPAFAPSLAHWGTTVQMDGKFEDDDAYLFTASSPFLTFSGTTATTTGETANNYTYVSSDGSTSAGITTFTERSITSVATGADYLTTNNHGFNTGQLVQYYTTGSVIGGLSNLSYYYVVVRDTNTYRLATTYERAISNNYINLTSNGSGNRIRSAFAFAINTTNISGFGPRYIHRLLTDTSGFASIGNVSFGTEITSSAIATYGEAYVYRVIAAGSGAAYIDFFFKSPTTNPVGSTNFIPNATSSAITHTVGTTDPVPDLIPLISLRLSPSVDGGITGLTGDRDVICRMQLTLDSLGVLTTHDAEIRLILNGQNDNIDWLAQGVPSLSQVVSHKQFDIVDGGIPVFTFRASGNTPDSSGKRTANSFTADISTLLSLGNSILGGDGVFPNGPDVLTIAAAPLNTTGITVNSPMSISARLSWSESQA